MKLKCLPSISSILNHPQKALYMVYGFQREEKKYMTENLKHSGDGFPWIFTEPKNCYRWFLMISGHGTEKLFSMGIEILGLQYIERGLLRMLFQSTRALNIFGSSLSRRVTMGLGN